MHNNDNTKNENKLFEDAVFVDEFEKMQKTFDHLKFEILSAHKSDNNIFYGTVTCFGQYYYFGCHTEADIFVLDCLEQESPPDRDFVDVESLEQDFADLHLF